ncbi:MAG: hypothetical protein WC683_05815 [bacterium]
MGENDKDQQQTGNDWTPTVQFDEKAGKVNVEVAKGEVLQLTPADLAKLAAKGRGYDRTAQEKGELERKFKDADAKRQELEDLFGPSYERISKLPGDKAAAILQRIEKSLETSDDGNDAGKTDDDDPFADLFPATRPDKKDTGLTEDKARQVARDEVVRLQIEDRMETVHERLGVPEDMREAFTRSVLKDCKTVKDIDKVADKLWGKVDEAFESRRKAAAEKAEAEKKAAGRTVTRMGTGATTRGNDDPRRKSDHPGHKEYLAERLVALSARG